MCQTKICTKCGEEKAVSEYNVGSYRKDGSARYRSVCKVCYRNSVRKYRANKDYKTPSETKEYRREYFKAYIPKGRKTNIKFIKCCDCGVVEVVRQRVKRDKRCLKCKAIWYHNNVYYPSKRIELYNIIRNCKNCGVEFESEHNSDYCTNKCRRKAIRKYRNGKTWKQRCEYYGGHYEQFDIRLVYKRDKNKCRYCGIKTKTTGDYNDLRYRTIDHVIPLSKGGSHTLTNCVVACRDCNNNKIDRMLDGVQFSIFTANINDTKAGVG